MNEDGKRVDEDQAHAGEASHMVGAAAPGQPSDQALPEGWDTVASGTFALYSTPDGGMHLVTDIPGRGVEHKHISGRAFRGMAKLVSGGGPFGRMFRGVANGLD
jgi:hypothetical protein